MAMLHRYYFPGYMWILLSNVEGNSKVSAILSPYYHIPPSGMSFNHHVNPMGNSHKYCKNPYYMFLDFQVTSTSYSTARLEKAFLEHIEGIALMLISQFFFPRWLSKSPSEFVVWGLLYRNSEPAIFFDHQEISSQWLSIFLTIQ